MRPAVRLRWCCRSLLALLAVLRDVVADLSHVQAPGGAGELAGREVARWDPRAARHRARSRRDNLPPDIGSGEARQLAGALHRPGRPRRPTSSQRERDFTRDASHELRTPLTVIRVASDLMLADPDASRARSSARWQRIQRAGRDMEAVIDAFLILAREADVEPLSEDFDVRDIVAEEVDKRAAAAGRQAGRAGRDRRGARRSCIAPPHVLAVMVGNLLRNAVQLHRSRHASTLHLSADRDRACATPASACRRKRCERAFDPFYRADPRRARTAWAWGCRSCVGWASASAGRSRCDSAPGQGTTCDHPVRVRILSRA